jgi:DNA-binding NarL/FixJ family response regulator
MNGHDSLPTRVLLVGADDGDFARVQASLGRDSFGPFLVVRELASGDVLRQCEEKCFDIILLDVSQQGSRLLDAFDEVLRFAEELPIVVLCPQNNKSIALEALSRGAFDCLVKTPAAFDILPVVLKQAVAKRKLSAQLHASEYRLSLLAEQLPALLWTTDAGLRITSWRGKKLPSHALSASEVMGRRVDELTLSSAHASHILQMHRRAFAGESITDELNWADRWYRAYIEPLKSFGGKPVGTIGVAVDVTHERKLMKEIAAAHHVQQHLLPAKSPDVAGFDIGGGCFPAEDCSGDFYDYITLPQRRVAIVLADVSGHGFAPAIMAAAIRSYLRTAAVLGHHVHEMLAICNRLLAHDAQEGPFATVFAVRLDTVSCSFQFASAGHLAYLMRANGDVESLQTPSVPVGVVEDEVFPLSRPIAMRRGDILLLASDGLLEARPTNSREMFGLARVTKVVQADRGKSAQEIVECLYRAALEYSAGANLEDDLTVVAIKRRDEVALDDTSPP